MYNWGEPHASDVNRDFFFYMYFPSNSGGGPGPVRRTAAATGSDTGARMHLHVYERASGDLTTSCTRVVYAPLGGRAGHTIPAPLFEGK